MRRVCIAAIAVLGLSVPTEARERKVPLPKPAPAERAVATIAIGEALPFRSAPGPGKAVSYEGFRCLMMAPTDTWAVCNVVGKIGVEACRSPVFIKDTPVDRWACLTSPALAGN